MRPAAATSEGPPKTSSGGLALVGSYLAGPLGAGAAVVVLCVATLTIFDVSAAQTLSYLGYEVGYVLLPGVAATLATTGARRLRLQEIVIGLGLGYAIEILAFVLTASISARGLFPWFPLPVVVLSLPFIRARPRLRELRDSDGGGAWSLAAVMAVLVGFLANSILDTPLPQHVYALRGYPTDMLWATSVTAEAMHHWPLQIPGFAGQPLYYHYFAFLHLAGASRVTGLSPWLLNFRFYPLWATLMTAFALYAVARTISGRRSAGVAAALLLLLANSFLPWTGPSNQVLTVNYISVTFAYGMLIWLSLLLALWLAIVARPAGYRRGSTWLLVVALAAAASGAKAPILAVAGLGLALTGLWALRSERSLFARIVAAAAIILAVFASAWFVLYRSANGSGLVLKPFGMIKPFEPFEHIAPHVPHPIVWLFWLLIACLIGFKMLLAAIPGIASSVRWSPRPDVVLLAGPLLAGLIIYFAFTNLGNSENYFAYYAETAGALLGGVGIAEAIARFVQPIPLHPLSVAAVVCALLVAWTVESPIDPYPKPAWQNIGAAGSTKPEYTGFRWIATHTSTDAVLAVDARSYPLSCFQTAFAERRASIDCYFGLAPEVSLTSIDSLKDLVSTEMFRRLSERVRINDEIFDAASPSALSTAYHQFGVRYVVVDFNSGGTVAEAARLARRTTQVFRNSAVAVFRVDATQT